MGKKTVLVTGASAGLGKQMAIDFAKSGYEVFITGRNEKELKTLSQRQSVVGMLVADLSSKKDVYKLIKACSPDILINIGSSSAYAGFSGSATYCSSKHALLGLSRSAFNEYKEHNIRVISVSPGSIKTKMGKKVKNQIYDTFIETNEISKFVVDLIEYDGNMVCEEVRLNRMFVQ